MLHDAHKNLAAFGDPNSQIQIAQIANIWIVYDSYMIVLDCDILWCHKSWNVLEVWLQGAMTVAGLVTHDSTKQTSPMIAPLIPVRRDPLYLTSKSVWRCLE